MKEGYVSDAQRKAVWAARNDKKEANEEVQFSDEELARIQEIINGTTDK
jgi:K+/H+ antiporter YhaU regulatory subunit KhtT